MQNFIINLMNEFGYLGIFSFITFENIFPLPREAILTFSFYMATYSYLKIFIIIIIATFGSLTGAIILYYAGKIFNEERLLIFTKSKYRKILKLKEKDIKNCKEWFLQRGEKCIFFGRFIPFIRSLIWNSILILLGFYIGKNWLIIIKILKTYTIAILSIILIITIIYFISENNSNKLLF